MFYAHLRRGALAGLAGGVAYGLFVALVGRPMVEYAETFEAGAGSSSVAPGVTAAASVAGGVLWGVLLGIVVFGALYFLFEPAIPGGVGTKSVLLGCAGFLTASGAPWLGLPPQPPGVEQALPHGTRLLWYGVFSLVGAVACGLAGYAYGRSRGHSRPLRALAVALPFGLLAVPVLVMPANPVMGPVPAEFVSTYQLVVAFGQVGLWSVVAGTHAWLSRRTVVSRMHGTSSTGPE